MQCSAHVPNAIQPDSPLELILGACCVITTATLRRPVHVLMNAIIFGPSRVLNLEVRHAHRECECAGHVERSRSELLLKLAGTENIVILAVNVLAVNYALRPPPLNSIKKCLYALHSVKKCRSPCRLRRAAPA